jgi:hypothetical protein
MKNRSIFSLRILLTSILCSGAALAQDPPPVATPPATTAPPPATTTAPAPMTASATVTTQKPAMEEATGDSDHDKMVGHLAVGYLGTTSVPIATAGGAGVGAASVTTPVVGVRYWVNPRIGIDGGLGLGWNGGSSETVTPTQTVTTNQASVFGVALHGGVPIALVSAKHYTFEVIPELNVGFATSTVSAQNVPAGQPVPPDTKLSGFKLDIGARAGAEVHFGFIGVPQLALQGTIGASFSTESRSVKVDTSSSSSSSSRFGTSVQASPWAIFTNNITALYYF